MRKNALVLSFEKHLVQLGCSRAQSRRSAGEIEDHYEDLKAGALEEGLSEVQAEARAAERLGDPRALAERLAATLRGSSWWGRHPFLGFFLLPSVGGMLLLPALPFVLLLAVKGSVSPGRWQAMSNGGAGYSFVSGMLQTCFYGSVLGLLAVVCGRARRAAVGLKWTMTACVLCSLQAAFLKIEVRPHNLSVGYFIPPNWLCAAIPLLCAAAIAVRQWSAARRLAFALLVAGLFAAPSAHAAEKPTRQRGWIGGEYKVDRPWSARQIFFPPPEMIYDRAFPQTVKRSQSAAIKITSLHTNTPAAVAGLRKGDLILAVDHAPVTRLHDFRRRIDDRKPGESIALTVFRDGQTMEFTAVAGKEEFRPGGSFSITVPSMVYPWRLWPQGGLSVVFAGWETPRGLRHELGSKKEVFDSSLNVWLGIFDLSTGKRVISQTNASPSPSTSKPAMAAL